MKNTDLDSLYIFVKPPSVEELVSNLFFVGKVQTMFYRSILALPSFNYQRDSQGCLPSGGDVG